MNVRCPSCKDAVPVAVFLAGCTGYHPALGTVRRTCPACGGVDDFRLVDGAVQLGYVYAAGSAHFAAIQDVPVPGLAVEADPDGLRVRLAEATWSIRR